MNLYVGPAGWNYKDWEGIVYPSRKEKNFDPLAYLSRFFNALEINSPFYRPPAVHAAKTWVERVKSRGEFLFTYKLWQNYTHQRDQFPGGHEETRVKQGLDVLRENGRLGALLIQFPWSFQRSPENYNWLSKVLRLFKDYLPVVEIRHDSWNEPQFFELLSNAGAGFANIDQPTVSHSIGLTNRYTSPTGYVRLHGRNAANWFSESATVASRYDYLYQPEELTSIKTTIEALFENNARTFIIFNNHYRGQAVANGLQMMHLFSNHLVAAPAELVRFYPQLESIARNVSTGGQVSLFGPS
ncbi:MAG: DUF72 domain-containing protein [Candidatus Zhuqueibacterota bacterium]